MTFEALDWVWTSVMLVASTFWLLVMRRGLRRITHDECPPDSARLLTLATVTLVCVLLLASSLLYSDIIGVEVTRFFVNVARIALLIGGAAVWWTGRGSLA